MRLIKYQYRLTSGLAVLLILSLSAACGGNLIPVTGNTAGNVLTLSECYQIRYLGSSREPEGASTWRYQVDELPCAVQDLSDWMLEVPACATVMDASPASWEVLEPDPILQANGIKWKMNSEFQGGEFSVKLSGALVRGAAQVGVKGPIESVGFVQGPVCDPNAPPPTFPFTTTPTSTTTATQTTTNTVTITSTPFVPLVEPTRRATREPTQPSVPVPTMTSTPSSNPTSPIPNTPTSLPANTATSIPAQPTLLPSTSTPAPTRTSNRPPTKTQKTKQEPATTLP